MVNAFLDLLADETTILLDGAMGTMLIQSGLASGECPEAWNVDHPERVVAIHLGYIRAGSRVILTNSFGGTRPRLKRHQNEGRVRELNLAAARVARQAASQAPRAVAVAGSIGPTGSLLKPFGPLAFDEARQAFREQAEALVEGGVDVLWIETMGDLNEVKAAYEGVRQVSDLPVVITMSFDTRGRTMMGVKPAQALQFAIESKAHATGANCGRGPGELVQSVGEMRGVTTELPLVAKANAGLPKIAGGSVVYGASPASMAEYALQAREAGARLIGACCGSTPEHIRAMAAALELPISSPAK
ncbi:MAG: betaine--homocysteine S-methyltransferase [Anaerolineales bacterium]|nr:betaine--homocysteine S-methyltransferase [Anaerolineales bacterium]